jgi:hypothetical protein
MHVCEVLLGVWPSSSLLSGVTCLPWPNLVNVVGGDGGWKRIKFYDNINFFHEE